MFCWRCFYIRSHIWICNRIVGSRRRRPKVTRCPVFAPYATAVRRTLDISRVALAVLFHARRLAAFASQFVRYCPRVGNIHSTDSSVNESTRAIRVCSRMNHTRSHHATKHFSIIFLKFRVESRRISRQDCPDSVLPFGFMLWCVFTS
jgi:hypothetical protein